VQIPGWNNPANTNVPPINGEDVVVAVIDTGVDYTNPDLDDVMWRDTNPYSPMRELGGGEFGFNGCREVSPEYDYDSADPMDDHGHGTHVAGIIAAEWNGFGISGGTSGVEIMGIKALDAKGKGSTYNICKGINYVLTAAESGVNVRVANLSLGNSVYDYSFSNAVEELIKHNIMAVIAAGNAGSYIELDDASQNKYTPGSLIVGASDVNGDPADFTNYGEDCVHVFAPGVDILSCAPMQFSSIIPQAEGVRSTGLIKDEGDIPFIGDGPGYAWYSGEYAYYIILNPDDTTEGTAVFEFFDGEDAADPAIYAEDSTRKRYLDFSIYVGNISGGFEVSAAIPCREVDSEGSVSDEWSWVTAPCVKTGSEWHYIVDFQSGFDAEDENGEVKTWRPAYYEYPAMRFACDPKSTEDYVVFISCLLGDVKHPYMLMSGTSQAAPAASACAAIAAAAFPDDSPEKIAARLTGGVTKVGSLTDLCISGGIINMQKILDEDYDPVVNFAESEEDERVLHGYFFGDAEGSLTADGKPCTVLSWSDTEIRFELPVQLNTGVHCMEVTTASGKDGHKAVSVEGCARLTERLPQPGYSSGYASRLDSLWAGDEEGSTTLYTLNYVYRGKLHMVVNKYVEGTDNPWTCLFDEELPHKSFSTWFYTMIEDSHGILHIYNFDKEKHCICDWQINKADGSWTMEELNMDYRWFGLTIAEDNVIALGGDVEDKICNKIYTWKAGSSEITSIDTELPYFADEVQAFYKDDALYICGGYSGDNEDLYTSVYRMPLTVSGGALEFGEAELLCDIPTDEGAENKQKNLTFCAFDSGIAVVGAKYTDEEGIFHDILVYDFEENALCYADMRLSTGKLQRLFSAGTGDSIYVMADTMEAPKGLLFTRVNYSDLVLTPIEPIDQPEDPVDPPVEPPKPHKPSRPSAGNPEKEPDPITIPEPVLPYPPVKFLDVHEDAYYAQPVAWAVSKGITAGISAEEFAPDASCTRAQAVTFLWALAGCPVVNYAMNFEDVGSDAYYAEAVRWAASVGITAGKSKDMFAPDEVCTRAQIVTFLANYAGGKGSASFSDVSQNSYYAQSVGWAYESGITAGVSAETFGPDLSCSRAQMVTFLYRFAVN
ncbi:MAG: S8 family serine peptidase, partial [Clostridia bacterium]|nr:S8 family serine peptidase [Clostridia bacterium]